MNSTILVAYDFSSSADAALAWVSELQRLSHGTTYVAHVIDLVPMAMAAEAGLGGLEPSIEIAEAEVRKAIARAGIDAIPLVVMGAGVGPKLIELAREKGASSIVVGTHGRGFLGRALMGSVAEYLLRHSTLPVMVFHEPAARAA